MQCVHPSGWGSVNKTMNLHQLIWHRINFNDQVYIAALQKYVRARGLNPDDDEEIATVLRKSSCLNGKKPGIYNVDLGQQAGRIRQYYNIHKSTTARDAWLLLIANRGQVMECEFEWFTDYFYMN